MTALKLALEEKNKEVTTLQQNLNSLLSTMAEAHSSGPVRLSEIPLNGVDGSPLEGLIVQPETQVWCMSVCPLSML